MSMTMSELIHCIRTGRGNQTEWNNPNGKTEFIEECTQVARVLAKPSKTFVPQIDATEISRSIEATIGADGLTCFKAEEHPNMAPPWKAAWVGHEYGLTNLRAVNLVVELPGDYPIPYPNGEAFRAFRTISFVEKADGYGACGPIHISDTGISDTGFWVGGAAVSGYLPGSNWCEFVVLATFNLLNCRNIELQPKPQTRQEKRRLERRGITTVESVLHIKHTGTRHPTTTTRTETPTSTRLHSVRGHVAHYGNCCPGRHEPRGLLFGQQTGRIWVPQHARGDIENGRTHQTFILETSTP